MRRNSRYDRNERVAKIGITVTIIGFLMMVVPVIMWSQTVGESLWEYIIPVLAGATLTYAGVQILDGTDVWWWR